MSFLPPGLNIDPSLLALSKTTSSTTSMSTTPPTTPDSNLYKAYLHKLPHLTFELRPSPPFSTCTACDSTTPFEHHICIHCGLQLCGVCQSLITDHLIRGDLKRLIQHIARWKLGYSKSFLERERLEGEQEWKQRHKAWVEREKIVDEGRRTQEDIDKLFERMIVSFKGIEELRLELS